MTVTYWERRLGGASVVDFPTDRKRARGASRSRTRLVADVPSALLASAMSFAEREQVSLGTVLAVVWATMLARYTRQDDVVIGIRDAATGDVWPLRLALSADTTFRVLVAQGHEARKEASAHPFRRDDSAMNLPFATAFSEGPGSSLDLDLFLTMHEVGGQTLIEVDYDEALFEVSTVGRLGKHFATLLASCLAEPSAAALEAPIVDDVDVASLVALAKGPDVPRPFVRIDALVREQARRIPDHSAIERRGQIVTYRELVTRAERLAGWLTGRLPTGNRVIGLWLDRSPAMFTAQLAVWMAGHAWVPLDVETPLDRAASMLRESQAALVLCSREAVGRADASIPCEAFELDTLFETAGEESTAPSRETSGHPQDLAYIIFTSGSTGAPKGVQLHHEGLSNLLLNNRHQLAWTDDDRMTQMGSTAFDSAIEEIWSPLTNGATVVMVEDDLLLSPPDLFRWLREQQMTRAGMPSSLFEACLDEDWSNTKLRRVGTGLEKLHTIDKPLPFVMGHAYGPTECTIGATRIVGVKEFPPPIGRPLDNIQVHVLDEQLRPVPQGALGEGYIGGLCVGRGYLRADLTAERFLPDPFGPPGARMYRTGDVLRLRNDGNLEFHGRADRQIKVRGYRIEPGEIESQLRSHAAVKEAIVVAIGEGSGPQRLVAYVVPRAPASSASLSDDLRAHLEPLLPDYMVPSAFVLLERIPLTPTGKVDHKALPRPSSTHRDYVAPHTAVERAIAEVWQEVLSVERVGVTDNFFDLGGHSLIGSRVVGRLRERLGMEITVRSLFDAPVLGALAEHLSRAAVSARPGRRPLVRVDRSSPMTLSFAEQRLLFLHDYEPSRSTYNVLDVAEIRGVLDEQALEDALSALVERHEGLRTRFVGGEGKPRRFIDPPRKQVLERLHVEPGTPQEVRTRAHAAVRELAQRPFDLAAGSLFRTGLVRLGGDAHVLVLVTHHIVSDGWSTEIVRSELVALYEALSRGRPIPLEPLQFQYADHAAWEQDPARIAEDVDDLGYWTERLRGLPNLELSTDRPRPATQSHAGADHHFVLEQGLTTRLHELARRERCSLFMVILAGFGELLARYSRQTDFGIGTPVAARERVEAEKIVGFFANTLVIRLDLAGEPTVSQLLSRVRESTLSAYAHQDVPLQQLVTALRLPRDTSRSPLFQAFFAMNNVAVDEVEKTDLDIRWGMPVQRDTAMFDITLYANESHGRMPMRFEFSTALFDADTVSRLAEHLRHLLLEMTNAPERAIGSLELLAPEERQRALADLNATVFDYPRAVTVPALFEAQVARTPDAVALRAGDRAMSYRELDQRASALADRLRAAGVTGGSRVGICLDRTAALVIASLAVMKAGAAYVPLDPRYPPDRLAFMAMDARLAGVLTETAAEAALPAGELQRWYVDAAEVMASAPGATRATSSHPSGSAAYVLYTSGSTGKPKGVMIAHRSVVNFLFTMRELTHFEPTDVLLAVTSLSFDIAGLELYLPLVTGGTVVLADSDTVMDGRALLELAVQCGVTFVQATPSTWRIILDAGLVREHGVHALCGGEALPVSLARQLFAATPSVWNVYGPTETTIWSTLWRIPDSRSDVLIGQAVGNTQVYVLDGFMMPTPAGVIGEIFIGGDGVAIGYLGRPPLTAERFVPDPFGAPGARLYRTGDLGRRRTDGQLEYAGRIDHQVKLRGFRIELGEIEAALSSHPAIREAVVAVREERGNKTIVAYVIEKSEAHGAAADLQRQLRAHLKQRLPEYMIPSTFVELAALPLTPNGKLDRNALPAPTFAALTEYVAPRDPLEEALAGAFQELLGLDTVGIHDDFFARGGHSLLAMQLVTRMRAYLGRELPLRALFEAPTIAGLAARIASGSEVEPPALERTGFAGGTILSFWQETTLAWERKRVPSTTWLSRMVIRFNGELSLDQLTRAIRNVLERQEALRQLVHRDPGFSPCLCDAQDVAVRVLDARDWPEETFLRTIREETLTPFELAGSPLVRFIVVRRAADDHRLFVTWHQLVHDATGAALLAGEILETYGALLDGRALPLPPAIRITDYAAWERSWFNDAGRQQVEQVRERLAGARGLALPIEAARSETLTLPAHVSNLILDEEESERFAQLCQAAQVTLFMGILAVVSLQLGRWCAVDDIVLVCPMSGRTRDDLRGLAGRFGNWIPVRVSLEGHPSVRDLFGRVRAEATRAYAQASAPASLVYDEVDIYSHPLARVVVNMPSFDSTPAILEWQHGPLLAVAEGLGTPTPSRNELSFFVRREEGRLVVTVKGNADLFAQTTIEQCAASIGELLRSVQLDRPSRPANATSRVPAIFGVNSRPWSSDGTKCE